MTNSFSAPRVRKGRRRVIGVKSPREASLARERKMAAGVQPVGLCRHCGHSQGPHVTIDGVKVCAACDAMVQRGSSRNPYCEFEEDSK